MFSFYKFKVAINLMNICAICGKKFFVPSQLQKQK